MPLIDIMVLDRSIEGGVAKRVREIRERSIHHGDFDVLDRLADALDASLGRARPPATSRHDRCVRELQRQIQITAELIARGGDVEQNAALLAPIVLAQLREWAVDGRRAPGDPEFDECCVPFCGCGSPFNH